MSVAPGELLGSADVEARATRPPGSSPARSSLSRRTRSRLVTGVVMMAPFAVLLGGLLGWPIVWTFVLSFTNEELTGPTALHHQFIGFSNFSELLHDGGFGSSIVHTLQYLVGSAYLGQIVFGFLLALLLRRCNRVVQALVGGIIILSWVVPELIAGFMWYALLGQDGVLQQAAHALGLPFSQLLVTHPMLAVNLANCWRGVAFSMLLFTAALAAFPDSLLEAAEVDGAGPAETHHLRRPAQPQRDHPGGRRARHAGHAQRLCPHIHDDRRRAGQREPGPVHLYVPDRLHRVPDRICHRGIRRPALNWGGPVASLRESPAEGGLRADGTDSYHRQNRPGRAQ